MPIKGLTSPYPSYPAHFDIEAIIRPNILSLEPYRSARDDYDIGILLDANENALGHSIPTDDPTLTSLPAGANLNRYPSPTHIPIKARLAELRGLSSTDHVFLGVGSDEVIDLVMRVTCQPRQDKILTCPPTYGMYKVTAQVNDVEVVEVPLITDQGKFDVDLEAVNKAVASDPTIKLIFLCSPGNPTGTRIPLPKIISILENPDFKGIVVVDEAYIDFAGEEKEVSAVSLVEKYGNVCVSQTLSKGHGLAAIRLGIAYSSAPMVQILSNTKAPYSVSTPTASLALSALSPPAIQTFQSKISQLIRNRTFLLEQFKSIPALGAVLGANHANFILVQVLDGPNGKVSNTRAKEVYTRMAEQERVVVRFRGNELGCEGCLRVTVGSDEECKVLVQRLTKVLA
ncbi:histidinol-phosphate aminotransferase [Phaffia rhodozyma]|uniref:histidinol-phosphate transaminase n=1 Tax=Phaffia rhodozyma TaxID=264483 RepID=A0A0F7SUF0_PHARH|nr:histidinol-phosphate aminotransferase [Phaffia rhodozyma]